MSDKPKELQELEDLAKAGVPPVYGGMAEQVYEEDVYVTGVYEGPEQLPATIFIGIG